jgi:O-antigen/teichoic acid export membrane protein
MLKSLHKSPSLRAAIAFGLGGAAFAGGNLIFARILSSYEYGLLSLVIGVIQVAGFSAPLGLDYLIARRGWTFGPRLRRTVLLASTLVGLGTFFVTMELYHLKVSLLIPTFVATAAMGISQAVAAHFQSQQQFGLSVPFVQASNWLLLLIAAIAALCSMTSATLPSDLIALTGLMTAAVGWLMVKKRTAENAPQPALAPLWGEAISLMTINVASSVLLQLERLIIPVVIGIEDLALFGVAAALVGSPFRMLQHAVTFTVVPRLRDASSIAERRRLLRHEFLVCGIVMGPAALVIWQVAPWLAHWLLGGRYDLSTALIVAMIVSGLLKVLSAFGTSVVSALAPDKGLRLLSAGSWVCIALAVGVAFVLRPWGLVGVIYAISVGWLVRIVVAFWISLPHLRATGEADASP